MHFLKAIFRFYINSSIHVALGVVSFLIISLLKFKIDMDISLILFTFFATVTGYNFVKYAPVAQLHHRSLTQQLQIIQVFSFICFIGLLLSCFFIRSEVLYAALLLSVLNIMYAVPLPRKNLREIPLLKIFIIALIWSVVTVVFPYFYNAHEGKFDLIWIFELIERFFLVILLMVPFEIRDFPYDKGHLKTIIAVWGLFKTKVISLIVIFMLCMSRIIFIEYEHSPFYFLLYLSLAIFILVSQTNQNIYFASFWVEALPIFWLILALLFI